jgi:hypothetical protein
MIMALIFYLGVNDSDEEKKNDSIENKEAGFIIKQKSK